MTAALNDRTVAILYRDEHIDDIHEHRALEVFVSWFWEHSQNTLSL